MASCDALELAAFHELLKRIGTGSFGQSVAHRRAKEIRVNERLRHQVRYAVDRPTQRSRGRRLRRLVRPKVAREDRDTAQNQPFGLGEQLVAPVERGTHRIVP